MEAFKSHFRAFFIELTNFFKHSDFHLKFAFVGNCLIKYLSNETFEFVILMEKYIMVKFHPIKILVLIFVLFRNVFFLFNFQEQPKHLRVKIIFRKKRKKHEKQLKYINIIMLRE